MVRTTDRIIRTSRGGETSSVQDSRAKYEFYVSVKAFGIERNDSRVALTIST